MSIKPLDYIANPTLRFAAFCELPHAVLLDCCHSQNHQGRYDIFTADPLITISTKNQQTISQHNHKQTVHEEDPLILTQHYLKQFPTIHSPLPFTIGAIGYLSYDFGRRYEDVTLKTQQDISIPEVVIGIYDWSVVTDHHAKQSFLITHPDINQARLLKIKKLLSENNKKQTSWQLTSAFKSNMNYQQYTKAFEQIKHHITQGDCYQVNFAQRFQACYQGSPWQAYLQLRQHNPAPFAAFMNINQDAVLSLSPERFIQVQDQKVMTQPIKGTMPRYPDPEKDHAAAITLMQSKKDRAENVMIVDLLRNDIGKTCIPGSVHVPKLCALESFSNVHHLVSTIEGEIKPDTHPLSTLKHCFPGGSITGAPKRAVMQIIENLEPHHRSLYCGSIFYCDSRGYLDSNITIRTVICNQGNAYCYAGGGIVYDSKCEMEYQETFSKINHLLDALQGGSSPK